MGCHTAAHSSNKDPLEGRSTKIRVHHTRIDNIISKDTSGFLLL
jgi:hypothetical protein